MNEKEKELFLELLAFAGLSENIIKKVTKALELIAAMK